jgi:hypothetical protein
LQFSLQAASPETFGYVSKNICSVNDSEYCEEEEEEEEDDDDDDEEEEES